MTSESTDARRAPRVSIGIIAWNEEHALPRTLKSLFEQSLFAELNRRGGVCEVICVANGCTDRTVEVATECLELQQHHHPYAECFEARVANLVERGKVNAWNQFVHSISDPHADLLVLMDADILIHATGTIWNMICALQRDPHAVVAVDRPCKDIRLKRVKSWRDRLSLGASDLTGAGQAQLCGQLYCIRAEAARNIYLPKDLAACEDGFIKTLVCTDFLTHGVWPERLRLAPEAEHTFEAYTSPAAILRNQKRQIIGQTIVHLLVDGYLKELPAPARERMAETLKAQEAADPAWLKRRIQEHLNRTRWFWRLYPGLLSQRFKRLGALKPLRRLLCLPAAAASFCAAFPASLMAYRTLKEGNTGYWPKAARRGVRPGEMPRRRKTNAQRGWGVSLAGMNVVVTRRAPHSTHETSERHRL